jgi:hypothetical protein
MWRPREGRGGRRRVEPYREPLAPWWVGDAAYLAALGFFVVFLHFAHLARVHQHDTWWASNGRDVANGLALVTLVGAIVLQGIAPHLAVLFAATLTIGLTVLHESQVKRSRHPGAVVAAVALVAGAPVVLAPGPSAELAARLLVALFGA